MLHPLLTVALGPLLIFQGRRARSRTLRMPEPPGARTGSAGEGPRLRLLILGDSAGAGVGASHQDEALLGQTVGRLAKRRSVQWRLSAKTGHTTADVLRELDTIEAESWDVAITTMGVNDVTRSVGMATWRRRQAELRRRLRALGVRQILVCGLPPVRGFPALPQPLRWYLGRRALSVSDALEQDVAQESDCSFLSLEFTDDPSWMAADGFHPGPRVYAEWGRRAAQAILERGD